MTTLLRLNKFLATQLGIGRRAADDLITGGRVRLNGKVPQLGARVKAGDNVALDGKPVEKDRQLIYLLMNKPIGYVCSKRQQGSTPTIYSLLPPEYQHLKTVGRLDKDSSGLILLTNDGDFAHQQTHPKFAKLKKYEVTLDKPLTAQDLEKLNRGITLPDGPSKLLVTPSYKLPSTSSYLVTMHEGRNRQIRRTFDLLGYSVTRLHRIQFGNFEVNNLTKGKFKSFQLPNYQNQNHT